MSSQLSLFLPKQPGRRRTPRGPCRVSFYPTTPLPRDELAAAIDRAQHQDEAVLAVFRASRAALAPSEVERQLRAQGHQMLLTSIRRSISSLTEAKALQKTNITQAGPHGSPEHLWIINP